MLDKVRLTKDLELVVDDRLCADTGYTPFRLSSCHHSKGHQLIQYNATMQVNFPSLLVTISSSIENEE